MIKIFKYGMILLFIFSTSIYSQYILRVENNQVIIQGSLRSQFKQYDEIYVKGIRDYKLVNIGILKILDFQGDSTIASIIDTFKNQKILKNDFILRRYDDRIDHNAFGIEFWTLGSLSTDPFKITSFKRSYKRENVIFNGKICKTQECLSNDFEPEQQNIDIVLKASYQSYDIGIFYRIKRFKFGWIPSSFYKKKLYNSDYAKYKFITDGKRPSIAGYDVTIKSFNIIYFEYHGLKVKDMEKSNISANLLTRIDYYKMSGNIYTYKYPFGYEWGLPPIILKEETKKLDEKFIILAIGPKVALNFEKLPIENTPLGFFKGVDVALTFDIPIGVDDFIIRNYCLLTTLVLEF
jgi:hypothetical protein